MCIRDRLNKQVVEYAMAIGLALNCEITRLCKFDRKNYFYPDNPQNYQISQLYLPIARNGCIEIERGGGKKQGRINEKQKENNYRRYRPDDIEELLHQIEDSFFLIIFGANCHGVVLVYRVLVSSHVMTFFLMSILISLLVCMTDELPTVPCKQI